MCGITGILNLNGRPVSVPVLRRMTDALIHRGPDGEGFWSEGPIGLGHRRLAIIDPTPAGHQPMQSRDGRFILNYNGEVYNFYDLRAQLESQGHQFRSGTDTEVVLAAWQEWGVAAVERFNGMFAFAVWDKLEQQLTLARDRFGQKPLYYWMRGETLLFASEVKALLRHPQVKADVSLEALNEYFTFQNTFSDLTLFEGVRLVPRAATLAVSLDRPSLRANKYWDYHFSEEIDADQGELVEELDRLFEQAVQRQLVADVEVGAYLSGGMDSGAVTSIAARNTPHLKSFTGGFDLSSASGLELGFDERKKSETLSALYRTEHYEVVLKAGDMERALPDLVWSLEDLRVGQSYPNWYVSRLASRFVKVVLSGTGGDELFAGYPWRYYRAVVNQHEDDYLAKYYQYWQRLIPDGLKDQFFQPHVARVAASHPTSEVFGQVMAGWGSTPRSPEDYVNRSLHFEAATFLQGLLMVEDKLSMAHSLETRVPFLDNDLVEFAMRVPVRHKLRDLNEIVRLDENIPGAKTERFFSETSDGKILLRQTLARYVPEAYTQAPKQGFSGPDASWFKGESIGYVRRTLLEGKPLLYEYLQRSTVEDLLQEHFTGMKNRRLLIWSLLCFESWCRIFLEGRPPAPSRGRAIK